MFSVLVRRPGRAGIAGRFLDKILPRRPSAEWKTAMDVPYLEVTIYDPAGVRSWKRVERLADTLCGKMLLPEEMRETGSPSIRRFDARDRFLPLVVQNTVCLLLEESGAPLYRRTAGLIDPKGIYQGMAVQLLRHSTALRVITEAPERYHRFSEQMIENFGAPVLLCEPDSAMADCAVAAAPGGFSGLPLGLRCPVVSSHDETGAGVVLSGLEVAPPVGLSGQIPEGISAAEFLGALFEIGGVQSLGTLAASGGRVGGRSVSLREFQEAAGLGKGIFSQRAGLDSAGRF